MDGCSCLLLVLQQMTNYFMDVGGCRSFFDDLPPSCRAVVQGLGDPPLSHGFRLVLGHPGYRARLISPCVWVARSEFGSLIESMYTPAQKTLQIKFAPS